MKLIVTLLLLIVVLSCKQQPKPPQFLFSDFNYCAFTVHYEDTTYLHKVFMRYYIHIDSTRHCRIMRYDYTNDSIQYFATTLSESLTNALNKLFSDTVYNDFFAHRSVDTVHMYDGFIYCFDYTSYKTGHQNYQFIPHHVPAGMLKLSDDLTALIKYGVQTTTAPFDANTFATYLYDYYIKAGLYPPPPKIVHFVPPPIKPDSAIRPNN